MKKTILFLLVTIIFGATNPLNACSGAGSGDGISSDASKLSRTESITRTIPAFCIKKESCSCTTPDKETCHNCIILLKALFNEAFKDILANNPSWKIEEIRKETNNQTARFKTEKISREIESDHCGNMVSTRMNITIVDGITDKKLIIDSITLLCIRICAPGTGVVSCYFIFTHIYPDKQITQEIDFLPPSSHSKILLKFNKPQIVKIFGQP